MKLFKFITLLGLMSFAMLSFATDQAPKEQSKHHSQTHQQKHKKHSHKTQKKAVKKTETTNDNYVTEEEGLQPDDNGG